MYIFLRRRLGYTIVSIPAQWASKLTVSPAEGVWVAFSANRDTAVVQNVTTKEALPCPWFVCVQLIEADTTRSSVSLYTIECFHVKADSCNVFNARTLLTFKKIDHLVHGHGNQMGIALDRAHALVVGQRHAQLHVVSVRLILHANDPPL